MLYKHTVIAGRPAGVARAEAGGAGGAQPARACSTRPPRTATHRPPTFCSHNDWLRLFSVTETTKHEDLDLAFTWEMWEHVECISGAHQIGNLSGFAWAAARPDLAWGEGSGLPA